MAHVNAPGFILALQDMLTMPDVELLALLERDAMARARWHMLHSTLWATDVPTNVANSIYRLDANPVLKQELYELLGCRLGQIAEVAPTLNLPYPTPLELHADYTRDEILAGVDRWTFAQRSPVREGVYYVDDLKTDLLFVTLNKAERDYSPTTLYQDYAVSNRLFHWQSQSTTSDASAVGQRYIHHEERGNTILLFVREYNRLDGLTPPYTFLGPVTYRSHIGSRPMSIIWELVHPIPAALLPAAVKMAVA